MNPATQKRSERLAQMLGLCALASAMAWTLAALLAPGLIVSIPILNGDLWVWPDRVLRNVLVAGSVLLGLAACLAVRAALKKTSAPESPLLSVLAPLAPCPFLVLPPLLKPFLSPVVSANLLFWGSVLLLSLSAARAVGHFASRPERLRIGAPAILATIVVSSVFFSLCGWYFTSVAGEHSGDEAYYLIQARSLHEDGDLDLRNNDPWRRHISRASRDGRWYSWHPMGLAVLLSPVAGSGIAARHAVLGLIAGLGSGAMLALCGCFGVRALYGFVVTGLISLSYLWGIYSCRALPEALGGTLAAWMAVAIFSQEKAPLRSTALAAVCCLALPWAHTRFLPVSVLGVALFALFALANGEFPWRRRLSRLLLFACLCAAGYAAYYGVQNAMFAAANSYNAKGVLMVRPDGMWHSLASRVGILYALPLFGCLLPAVVVTSLRDRDPKSAAVLLILSCVLATSCASRWFAGGACLSGRFLVVIVPLFAGVGAMTFQRSREFARLFFIFLGMLSCAWFALALLRLPLMSGGAFANIRASLDYAYPSLRGFLDLPLAEPRESLVHPFALLLYLAGFLFATGLLRRRLLAVVCVAALVLAFAAEHLKRYRPFPHPAPDAAQAAETLSQLDLDKAAFAFVRGPDCGAVPLLSAINRFPAPENLIAVTTRDLGGRMQGNTVSQPRLEKNDWAGRDYAWTTVVTPFAAGKGERILRIAGESEGSVSVILCVREGSQTLLETELPGDPSEALDSSFRFLCSGRGDTYILLRLEGESGLFRATGLWFAPVNADLARAAGLSLPMQR